MVTFTQVVARIYPHIGPWRLMSGGLVWVGIVLARVSLFPFDINLWVFRLAMFLLGCGMARVFVSNQAAALATILREQTGRS